MLLAPLGIASATSAPYKYFYPLLTDLNIGKEYDVFKERNIVFLCHVLTRSRHIGMQLLLFHHGL